MGTTHSCQHDGGTYWAGACRCAKSGSFRLHSQVGSRAGRSAFGVADVSAATFADAIEDTYHRESLRALRQRLQSVESTGLFDATGTPLTGLLQAGTVTVVLLGRLPSNQRAVVVAVLTRMLIHERSAAAFAEKRLALDPTLDDTEESSLETTVGSAVPRTVVALDEAQAFLSPDASGPARSLFVRLVKEGRNMGLSAVLATQQPSAIDQRILSQVETFVSHQLVTEADIRAVKLNLKSTFPDSFAWK